MRIFQFFKWTNMFKYLNKDESLENHGFNAKEDTL